MFKLNRLTVLLLATLLIFKVQTSGNYALLILLSEKDSLYLSGGIGGSARIRVRSKTTLR